MPQFDIFSFFSQLFWVFLGFTLFFLLVSLYLLPSIAAILKVRKRKLVQSGVTDSNALSVPAAGLNHFNSNFLLVGTVDLAAGFSKLSWSVQNTSYINTLINTGSKSTSFKKEGSRKLSFKLLNQALPLIFI